MKRDENEGKWVRRPQGRPGIMMASSTETRSHSGNQSSVQAQKNKKKTHSDPNDPKQMIHKKAQQKIIQVKTETINFMGMTRIENKTYKKTKTNGCQVCSRHVEPVSG